MPNFAFSLAETWWKADPYLTVKSRLVSKIPVLYWASVVLAVFSQGKCFMD